MLMALYFCYVLFANKIFFSGGNMGRRLERFMADVDSVGVGKKKKKKIAEIWSIWHDDDRQLGRRS